MDKKWYYIKIVFMHLSRIYWAFLVLFFFFSPLFHIKAQATLDPPGVCVLRKNADGSLTEITSCSDAIEGTTNITVVGGQEYVFRISNLGPLSTGCGSTSCQSSGYTTYWAIVGGLEKFVPNGTDYAFVQAWNPNKTSISMKVMYICGTAPQLNGCAYGETFITVQILNPSPSPPSGTVTATNMNDCNLYSFGVSGTLCGSGSYTYKWDFGDGSPVSNSSSPQHPFFQKGTYMVAVEVTGSCGTSTFNKEITIQ